jgi:hypothetical protein
MPRPLYPRERAPGIQSRSGRGGEERNSHHLSGIEPTIIQPVAQCCTTELSRLHIYIYIYYILLSFPVISPLLFIHIYKQIMNFKNVVQLQPEEGGKKFLRNIGILQEHYTA